MESINFQKIDKTIHEKGRMAIMSLLASSNELSFTEIKKMLAMTDGNLSVHIRNLQKAGYVDVTKSFVERKPRTTCKLSKDGRKAFTEYIGMLEQIVGAAKK